MSKTTVILQPLFFPWLGVFEQIALSDTYVHFDHIQYPQGRSFTNRAQIKTPTGVVWMTVPLVKATSKGPILDVQCSIDSNWKRKHLELLRHSYSKAPYWKDLSEIINMLYAPCLSLCELNIFGLETIATYFGISTKFERSSKFLNTRAKSELLVDICKIFETKNYITGHGALNYLDKSIFSLAGIDVRVMKYAMIKYPQLHGDFTPYVSVLDTIANVGPNSRHLFKSKAIPLGEF